MVAELVITEMLIIQEDHVVDLTMDQEEIIRHTGTLQELITGTSTPRLQEDIITIEDGTQDTLTSTFYTEVTGIMFT
jgi:hypothetical protein